MVDAFEATEDHVKGMMPAFMMLGGKVMAIEDEDVKKKLMAPKTPEEEAGRKEYFDKGKAGETMTKEEFATWQTVMADHDKEKYGAGLYHNAEESAVVYDCINAVTPGVDGITWDDMYHKMKKIHIKKKEMDAAAKQ